MNRADKDMDKPLIENKLIPVMREAITTVQMLLFKELRQDIHNRYADVPEPHHTRLAGAVINNLFGTQPADREVAAFAAANRELVELELRELAARIAPLLPLITDTLRMKIICDNQEGIHSIPSLLMARALGILQESRPLPLPSTFMLQVRTLAVQHGLVEPMQQATASSEEPPV
ncbi:hypothetical protein [Desulfobulbus oligotrophicus]|jgi:hypothetical protein|uniref:Uncharacterized protein n=1 Tax=Desulfobulbus oligotrophicus TaxID=1909699 RepID=A0A7T5VER6_9BACT|nr:hypothetical protein [Desulfobulbus oligotrophicus]MDY0390605.1 hypothetical protein [Desulfobulbus oligotrophicus]QQG66461.1 hypothetical protein HP555_11580 [Desulfobulbus oligotrophicus]